MSQILELKLPDSIHKALKGRAQSSGMSEEALAIELLKSTLEKMEADPLERFIGAIDSGGSDWVSNHDSYVVGQSAEPDKSET